MSKLYTLHDLKDLVRIAFLKKFWCPKVLLIKYIYEKVRQKALLHKIFENIYTTIAEENVHMFSKYFWN